MVIDLDDSGYSYAATRTWRLRLIRLKARDEFAARDWFYGDPTQGKYDPAWGTGKGTFAQCW